MPTVFDSFSHFINSLKDLPLNRKITLILVIVFLIGGITLLFSWLSKPNHQILYSRLTQEDAGAIVAQLKEKKISFLLKNGGSTILVPEDRVYELRLQLATDKILQKGNIGFEIFDQTNLGTTEFVQTINYQRALQGELGRTIGSIAEIEWARVHLAIPQKSLFVEKEQPTTASVVIGLTPGSRLRQNQITGIVHLVSCSVEGLSPENIRVIDDKGRILSENPELFSDQRLQTVKMEYQAKIENSLEKKVTSILEKALGENKVIARVSVSLNLKRIESTEEKYDPEQTVIKTEQRVEESSQGQTPVTPAGGNNSTYKKSDETINYELTKATNHVIQLPGQITRLSIAVLIDGIYEKTDQGVQYVPRTPEEIKSIRTIVEKAVGYDQTRGDQIEVVNIPFYGGADKKVEEKMSGGIQNRQFWLSIAKYGAKVILALILLLLVFRPLLKWLYQFTPSSSDKKSLPLENREPGEFVEDQSMIAGLQENLPERVDKLEVAIKAANSEESKKLEQLVNAMREIAKQEPKRIAQLTHEWLQEERSQS